MQGTTFQQEFLSRLWWSKLRRPFEALARRVVRNRGRILAGPLKGRPFCGGLAEVLGVYELHVQRVLCDRVKPGSIFFDIGANSGYFTLLASTIVGKTGSVFAFEPLPENVARIRSVVGSNDLANVHIVEAAVSSLNGNVLMTRGKDGATPSIVAAGVRTVEVLSVTIDHFSQRHSMPDFVIVDVEGAETLVLEGAVEVLACQRPPSWLIEIHDEQNLQQVCARLRAPRFRLSRLPGPRAENFPCHLLAEPVDDARA